VYGDLVTKFVGESVAVAERQVARTTATDEKVVVVVVWEL
jgi:hypothetical protein